MKGFVMDCLSVMNAENVAHYWKLSEFPFGN